jgi:hypothetical protein
LVFVLVLERLRRNHEDRSMGSVPLLSFRNLWMIRFRKLVVFRLIDVVPSSVWVVCCCQADLRFWFREGHKNKN